MAMPARILIVEDETVLARSLARSLESLGYETAGKASSAEEAIRIVEESRPNLVLMDIKLDGVIDGIEAAGEIRDRFEIPVVYVTGFTEKDILERAKVTEPYGYLGKPVTLLELRSTIETALYKHDADRRLRESEERYRLIFSKEKDAILLADAETLEFLDANKAAERLWGYSREELMHMTPLDLSAEMEKTAESILAGTQPEGVQVPLRWHKKKDGTVFPVEISGSPITLKGRKVVCSIIRDITERTRAEETLRKSHEDLEHQVKERTSELRQSELWTRSIFNSLEEAVLVVTPDRLFSDINPASERIFGYTKDEVVGRSTELFHVDHEHYLEFGRITGAAFERREPAIFEFAAKRKNGEIFPSEHTVSLLRDSDGEVVGIVSIAKDITNRRITEERLKESEQRLELAMQGARLGLWDWNVQTGEDVRSHHWAEILGYTGEDIQDKVNAWTDRIHPDDRDRAMRERDDHINGHTPIYVSEHRLRTKSGEWRWIQSRGAVVERDGDGKPVRMTGTILDIHDRKNGEEALQKAHDALELSIVERTQALKRANEALKEAEATTRLRNSILEIFLTIPDDQVYAEVLKLILNVTGSKYGTFGYFNHEGTFTVPYMTREVYWERCRVPEKDIIFECGKFSGIWGRAIGEKRTLYANSGPFDTPKGHIAIHNTMATPIVFRDEVISAIHIANKSKGYDDADVRTLDTIARSLAPILAARLERDRREAERKKAEADLIREKQFNERLIEAQLDTVFVFDPETGKPQKWNRGFNQISGYSDEEIASMRAPEDYYSPGDLTRLAEATQTVLQNGKARIEASLVTKDRRSVPFEYLATCVEDQDGKPRHIIAVGRDITERKKAEDRIKASLQEKEVLLREIHHRVKNNLAVINSLLNLQANYAANASLTKMFGEAQVRIRSMGLAHELLYQSENLANVKAADYVENLVNQVVVCSGIAGMSISLEKKIEEISFDLDTAIPIGFLLTELVSNCVKHAFKDKRDGEIRISMYPINKKEFELIVADNGIGMPESIDMENPTSLGLDLVNAFVQQLRGKIDILRDKGTKVRIRFQEAH
jgi:PAS domain S-box-containing protein